MKMKILVSFVIAAMLFAGLASATEYHHFKHKHHKKHFDFCDRFPSSEICKEEVPEVPPADDPEETPVQESPQTGSFSRSKGGVFVQRWWILDSYFDGDDGKLCESSHLRLLWPPEVYGGEPLTVDFPDRTRVICFP